VREDLKQEFLGRVSGAGAEIGFGVCLGLHCLGGGDLDVFEPPDDAAPRSFHWF
jgi:hypothetical protein